MAHQSMVGKHSLDPTGVSQHEVLRPWECEVVRDQGFALKRHWKPRPEGGDLFTLGVASYSDAVDRHDAHLKEAGGINPVMRANFDWLCERIRIGFEDLLGRPVSYNEECALPAFHIFIFDGGDQTDDQPSSRAHFDMQWMDAMPRCRPEETFLSHYLSRALTR